MKDSELFDIRERIIVALLNSDPHLLKHIKNLLRLYT